MKKLFSFLCIIPVTVLCMQVLSATAKEKDQEFSGTIKYSIKIEGDISAQEKAQLPTEMKKMYKGNKIRSEEISPMQSKITISDRDALESTLLLDIMGNKIALKSKKEDFTKTEEDTIQATVKETEEKKNIIGYNCKKAMISLEEITLEVWYTDEISIIEPNWDNGLFKDIKGVLMEYTIEVEGFKMIYTATEVKKGKLKDSIFNIPPGYKEMTREELKNLFSE